ncbi:MAG: MAPEG family protein, partial [Rhodoferax sp.]|nr:MAPEG family protein [Rhodoferax sp.]
GRARTQYGVKPPAMAGHAMFERALRVQMNTLEQLACFLPCLLIAGQYWPGAVVAGIGAVYLVGRQLYRQRYVADPATRGSGFLLTVLPTFVLFALGIIGALGLR